MHPLLVLANKITFTHKNYPMIMKHKFLLILTALLPLPLLAQETAIAMDHEDEVSEMFTSIDGVTIQEAVRATQKHGLHWCMMPFLTYSEQLGFTGKVAGSLFDFGNAGNFPNYDQLIYGELSYSTRRAGTLRAYYDSKKLIENFKFDADITFQPDALYDFYGFNGYASNYDYYLIQPFYNENYYIHDNPDYISSTFYRMKRNYLRAAADIRGIIKDSLGLFWHAGLGLQYYSVGHVDIERYNRGKTNCPTPSPSMTSMSTGASSPPPRQTADGIPTSMPVPASTAATAPSTPTGDFTATSSSPVPSASATSRATPTSK